MNDSEKMCPKCKNELPLVDFYINKKTGQPYPRCKECRKRARREYYYSKKGQTARKRRWETGGREKQAEYQREYRQTERGKEVFKRYETSEKGKTKNRRYRQSEKGGETKRRGYARRMEDPAYRERMQAYWRRVNRTQPAKDRRNKYIKSPKGREAKLRKDRKYKKSEKGLEAAKRSNTRRHRLLEEVPCTLTLPEWNQIKVAQNHQCHYCGEKAETLTQDHMMPVSRGGAHTKENVVAACPRCNIKKSNKLLSEIPDQFFTPT